MLQAYDRDNNVIRFQVTHILIIRVEILERPSDSYIPLELPVDLRVNLLTTYSTTHSNPKIHCVLQWNTEVIG